MPTWATMMVFAPTTELWPICTRLSIFVPRPITVSPRVARSIAMLAPISTSSSTTTRPTWGIFRCACPSKTYPNPSAPSTLPG